MTLTQHYLKQLQEESVATRKMLTAIPNDKLDWQPHPKSMTVRALATHIGELPAWVAMTVHTNELDFATAPYDPVKLNSSEEFLAYFEKELASGISALEKATDADLLPDWTLRNGDHILVTRSKDDMIRVCISQIIHHRAQLGVFLRLLDVPIPGTYGPSADDKK